MLWPGRSYEWAPWNRFAADIAASHPKTPVLNLAGRPPGRLGQLLPKDSIALIVRPDGHLERVLQPNHERYTDSTESITTALYQLHQNEHTEGAQIR